MKKYIIYTGIFGEYDDLPKVPQSLIKEDQEFICFSGKLIKTTDEAMTSVSAILKNTEA